VLAPLSLGAAQSSAPRPCKEDTYGTTGPCTFTGNALKHHTVVVVVSKPAPKIASSAALAAWRNDRAKRMGMAATVTGLEGLGVPAIRSGDTPPTVEAQALAKAAVGRIR